MRYKNIKNDGKTFLLRISQNLKIGSIKLHIILDDDIKAHTHPWDFKSRIIFGGYIETIGPISEFDNYYYTLTYGFWDVNIKKANVSHLVKLRRLWGFKIPCITIGYYSEKKQLCSLCQELGYCKSNKK